MAARLTLQTCKTPTGLKPNLLSSTRCTSRRSYESPHLICRAAQAGFTGKSSGGGEGDGAGPAGRDPPDLLARSLAASTSEAAKALEALPPAGIVSQLIGAYQDALNKHPVATKAVTSLLGFAIGDRIAQTLGGGPFDAFRALRLACYGLLIDGPLGHYFYQLLDKHIRPEAPRSAEAVLAKTAIDQLIWAPTMTAVFLAFLTILEGRPEAALSVVQAKLIPIMLANFTVWPVAHLINFRFVPPEQRILFNNVVAVAWTTYLSHACGGPAGGHMGTPRDALAGGVPCAAQAAAAVLLQSHHVTDATHLCAMETVLHGWGASGLPNAEAGSELLLYYMRLKADLFQAVCAAHALP